MKPQVSSEIERIKRAYEKRKEMIGPDYYSLNHPANCFLFFRREEKILKLLSKYGLNPFNDKKILDLGCGTGGELRNFIRYGAVPQNLYGVDLLQDRIEQAKMLSPDIDFRCGNAEKLTYEDNFFDIVMQFTVFTSIRDPQMKDNIAKEMLRVLKSTGVILWYDYFISKPTNPDTKGIGRRELKRFFPYCSFDFNRITLAPPITRKLAPISLSLCQLLEKVSFLRTHYLVIIHKGRKK